MKNKASTFVALGVAAVAAGALALLLRDRSEPPAPTVTAAPAIEEPVAVYIVARTLALLLRDQSEPPAPTVTAAPAIVVTYRIVNGEAVVALADVEAAFRARGNCR